MYTSSSLSDAACATLPTTGGARQSPLKEKSSAGWNWPIVVLNAGFTVPSRSYMRSTAANIFGHDPSLIVHVNTTLPSWTEAIAIEITPGNPAPSATLFNKSSCSKGSAVKEVKLKLNVCVIKLLDGGSANRMRTANTNRVTPPALSLASRRKVNVPTSEN